MFKNAIIWNCNCILFIDKDTDYKDIVEYAKSITKMCPTLSPSPKKD